MKVIAHKRLFLREIKFDVKITEQTVGFLLYRVTSKMSIGCVCERTQRFVNLRENCIQKYTGTLFISVRWCLGDIECRRLSIQPAHHFGVRDFFPFIAVTVKDCGGQSCLNERELNVIECQWAIRRRTLHVASAADACGLLRYKKFDE